MKEVKDLPRSVRAKLKNLQSSTFPFIKILKYYGMERFLYRLSKSKHKEDIILKGALMFRVWDVKGRRITLDIDFLAYFDNKLESIEKLVKEICRTEVEPDGLIFDESTLTTSTLKEGAEYEGVRVNFEARLAEAKIPIQIDFGFGDKIYPGPVKINYPTLLDLPGPKIKAYPVESVISEKFSAMIEKGAGNSRMKDFYDIWLLKKTNMINKDKLKGAIKATFENREYEIPSGEEIFPDIFFQENSSKQVQWKSFVSKNSLEIAPEELAEIVREINGLMKEVLLELNKEKEM